MTNEEYLKANDISLEEAFKYFEAIQKSVSFETWLKQEHKTKTL